MSVLLIRSPIVGILLAVIACTATATRPAVDRYALQISDNVSEHRFDMVLKSHDDQAICVQVDKWPNRSGQLHMGSDLAKLRTDTGVLQALDENFGYCPGGCGQHRIEPHGELRGFIAYEAFGDPEQLAADASKKLQFLLMPFYC